MSELTPPPPIAAVQPDLDDGTEINRFICTIAPHWIKSATAEQLDHLHASLSRYHSSHVAIEQLLSAIEPADTFAVSHYGALFNELLGRDIDIAKSEWLEFGLHVEQPPVRINDVDLPGFRRYSKSQDLLRRLLRGFETAQCDDSFYYPGSGVVENGELLPLEPERVAARCRQADIGKRYLEHIDGVIYPVDPDSRHQRLALLSGAQRDLFFANAYCSYLQGELDEHALKMCLDVDSGSLGYGELPVRCVSVDVFGVLLANALVFEAIGEPLSGAVRWYKSGLVRQVILYLPGDRLRPFRQYASWYALRHALGEQLAEPEYRRWFIGQFQRDRQLDIAERLSAQGATPELEITTRGVGSKLFDILATRQIWRIKADAAALIVPVALLDDAAYRKKAEQLESAGLGALQLLGSFIPGVGELMLVATVKDLLSQVYEGVEDWTHGECTQALDHFMGALRTVAVSAITGAAVHIVARQLPVGHLQHLIPVIRRDNVRRLWANQAERAGSSTFLLNSNEQEGWWRSEVHPLEWTGAARMLSREDTDTQDLGDDQLNDLLRISGIDESYLRGCLVEEHSIPVELRDSLERFQADRRIDRLLDNIAVSAERARESDSELFERARQLLEPLPVTVDAVFQKRHPLFQSLVSETKGAAGMGHDVMRRDFPGLPDRYADVLLEHMNAAELEQLESGSRIPLSTGQRIVRMLRGLRVKRALEGIYFNNFHNPDSVRVIFAACSNLAEWPRELSLHVKSAPAASGVLYSQSGQSPVISILVPEAGRVQVDRGTRLEAFDDIYKAIIDVLGTEPCSRLGWKDGKQARQRVTAKVLEKRELVSGWLNLAQQTPAFRPVLRLADGRLGYPLSGRAPARISLLARMARSLYPGFDNDQIQAFLDQTAAQGGDVFSRLLDYQEDYRRLEQALHAWREQGQGLGKLKRSWIIRKIKRCWRRQTTAIRDHGGRILGYSLKIDSREFDGLGEFPEVDFSHVTDLRIHNARLSDNADRFLSCFKSLKVLVLERCGLERVPAALRTMRKLKVLSMRRNTFVLQPEEKQIIGSLNGLQTLDLTGIDLSVGLDLHGLTALGVIRLRDCKLGVVPESLISLPFLEFADLRGNGIRRMPGGESGLLPRIQNALLLSDQDNVGLDHWFYAAQDQFLRSLDDTLRACLKPFKGQERSDRVTLWNSVAMEEGARDFFEIIARLKDTTDFKNAHSDLCGRIWSMLTSMHEDTGLREALFNVAAQPVRCIDSVANVFSDLEVRCLVYQIGSAGGGIPKRLDITRLVRGLFRLEQLQNIARADMVERSRSGKEVDEIEISLAYRMALKEQLHLPGQPVTTKFSDLVKLTPVQVQHAIEQVTQAEASNRFPAFVNNLDFWREYLRKEFPARFEQVEDIYWRELEQLGAQQSVLAEGVYLQKMKELGNRREEHLRRLESELTDNVLY